MNEDLSIRGTLAETTVADLMRSLIRSGETAVLSIEAIGRHDNIYFSEGRIVFATSSDPDLGLAEVLLRSGEINLEQYIKAEDSAVSPRPIGSVLCELGYLEPDELKRAIEHQVSTIVTHSLCFRLGSYQIDFTSDFPHETMSLSFVTERLVIDGIKRIEHWSLISRGIGRMDRVLQQVPGSDSRVYHLDLNEDEYELYATLETPQTVEAICAMSYVSNFITCRTAWALLAVNLLEEVEKSTLTRSRAIAESEMDLETEIERYNSAFQAIFALVQQEIGDHIYDFIDRVIRHLSPETMPYLSGTNMGNESRLDFDQLFNNIISSGSENKAAVVHTILNELLYGWIFEIRQEFGNKLDTPLGAIVNPLKL